VNLLLDEHLSPQIAHRLVERGHDVVAAAERSDLRTRSDRVNFAIAADEQRAITTRDFGDFRPMLRDAMERGRLHYGLVCVPPSFRQGQNHVGPLIAALDALLVTCRDIDAAFTRGGEIWLQPAR
jgi:hypothetical protein